MARGHEQALAAVRLTREDEPLPVDGEAQDLDALDARHVDDIRVARILDAQGLARRQQKLDRKVERLLAADRDQDLVGMGDDAALCEHALNELLDQHRIVDIRVVGGPVPDLDDVD